MADYNIDIKNIEVGKETRMAFQKHWIWQLLSTLIVPALGIFGMLAGHYLGSDKNTIDTQNGSIKLLSHTIAKSDEAKYQLISNNERIARELASLKIENNNISTLLEEKKRDSDLYKMLRQSINNNPKLKGNIELMKLMKKH